MSNKQDFYDSYHTKNNFFYSVISRNNFTYFLILNFFYDAAFLRLLTKKKSFEEITLLDVGCGVGTLAFYFASLGATVKGIDVSQRAIDICNEAKAHLALKNVTFKKELLKKGEEECDLVVSSEVIEHVEDEDTFLKNISSHLKPGGLLFLTTPSKENSLYRLGFYKKFDEEVGHLRRYTSTSLKKVLEKNHFEILEMKKSEGPLRNILYTTKLGFLIRFLRGPLVPLFHYFDSWTVRFFGASNIMVVAQKK